jgi:hypothetical protein
MTLKEEYEKLSKEIENIRCNINGCDYCGLEEKCSRIKFLETYCKNLIK